jgi:hypothetical protein
MASSGMLCRVALVRTDLSEKRRGYIIRNNVSSNRRTLLVFANVPSSTILVTLMMEALRSSETSVHTRATLRSIQEDGILYSHRRENLKCYIALTDLAL